MNRRVLIALGIVMLTLVVVAPRMLDAQDAAAPAAPAHVITPAAAIKWGPAPPIFNAGAMMAVMSGDPGKTGPFVVRLKMPAGYAIKPHWHPTDEHVTVISGTFALGMGDTYDPKAAKGLGVGGYAVLPAEMHHFAVARTASVVQVHAMGPFVLTYVNPADDPSKAPPAAAPPTKK